MQLVEYYKKHTECYSISEKVFDKLSAKQNGAGIVLVTKIVFPNYLEYDYTDKMILVCDGIEISSNIGTIFRTSEALNVDLIIFTNPKAKVLDNKVVHASRGMIFNVPFVIVDEVQYVMNTLAKNHVTAIICEPEQGEDFKNFDYSGSIALVVGSERYGVSKCWFEEPNNKYLKIKMFGEMDSLNVAVATSLILYEAKYNRKK